MKKIDKSKLKKIIGEILTFTAMVLLIKFVPREGETMTWREILIFLPIFVLAYLGVNVRNHILRYYIFPRKEDIEETIQEDDKQEDAKDK